jgi:hypothetical protein
MGVQQKRDTKQPIGGVLQNETPKSASETGGPEWRFWSQIPDTETGRYPRNAPGTAWF